MILQFNISSQCFSMMHDKPKSLVYQFKTNNVPCSKNVCRLKTFNMITTSMKKTKSRRSCILREPQKHILNFRIRTNIKRLNLSVLCCVQFLQNGLANLYCLPLKSPNFIAHFRKQHLRNETLCLPLTIQVGITNKKLNVCRTRLYSRWSSAARV